MAETYGLEALIPESITVYKSRSDYEMKTDMTCPTYNPDKPNCYFTGDVTGLMRLEDGTLVPYTDSVDGVNMPGPYIPIVPLNGAVTFGGIPPRSRWFVIWRSWADEIATAIGLPVLTSKDVGLPPAVGVSSEKDAYFVKVAGIYTLNLGDALATKAPYGWGSPGKWVLNESQVRIYWEPDVRVNEKTLPIPYRPLAADERLQPVLPMGYVVVKGDDGRTGSAADGEMLRIVKGLEQSMTRLESLMGQMLLRP